MSVDIKKTVPEAIRNRIIPSWFDMSLFPGPAEKVNISSEEWKKRLSGDEYRILRAEGTEMPHANEYHNTDTEGIYICRGCSNPLFSSETKFTSRSGWPSFFAPISLDHIGISTDTAMLMERTEVHCGRCGGHLGHVFDDGPEPTGLRYCLNSPALRLIDRKDHEKIAAGREDQLDYPLHR